jgi:preprotein translocase subunit SecA
MKEFINGVKLEGIKLQEKSEEDLILLIEKIKKLKQNNSLNIEEMLKIQWFALVQEISFRKIGLKHFDSQLLAGYYLNEGKIVEMKTGEGKTLVSTLPLSYNALDKKGVHLVTVNDYLAERDQKWMGKVFEALGLTCGLIKSDSLKQERKKSYQSDITYITNSQLVFDYLRDSSASTYKSIVQRPLYYCLIDEIDSILIDESRTPLIISDSYNKETNEKLIVANKLAKVLKKDIHFEIDQKRRDLYITEEGYIELLKRLKKVSLYDPLDHWMLEILNALKAHYLFLLDKDYILLDNKVIIIDQSTGRIMPDRRWSMGLHEAVEAKEQVKIGNPTKTKTSITYQNFFTMYTKLSGMTGTAKTAEKEFEDIYNLKVVVVPTNKELIRKDFPDYVYKNDLSKWKAVLNQSKNCFERGQPILIGTSNIEKSEFLSELFKSSNIPHQLLNAKPQNVRRENEIIAQAGKRYAITIATNMAGRGTDIILGGNLNFQIKKLIKGKLNKIFFGECNLQSRLFRMILAPIQPSRNKEKKEAKKIISLIKSYEGNLKKLKKHIENLPYSLDECKEELKLFYNELYNENYIIWKKENELVKDLGGLFVLGTERHETRRIDDQLRGRAGRQGDPGMSRFFLSLEDRLLQVFGGQKINQWLETSDQNENSPLEFSFLSKSIVQAQQKVEMYYYDTRKTLFEYDDLQNRQRKQFFTARRELLSLPYDKENPYEELFLSLFENSLNKDLNTKYKDKKFFFNSYLPNYNFGINFEVVFSPYSYYSLFKENLKNFWKNKGNYFQYLLTRQSKKKFLKKKIGVFYKEIWITYDLNLASTNYYQLALLKKSQKSLSLRILDYYWTQHLEKISYIKETINWQAYGQENPLLEYNRQGFESFQLILKYIRESMVYYFQNPYINL